MEWGPRWDGIGWDWDWMAPGWDGATHREKSRRDVWMEGRDAATRVGGREGIDEGMIRRRRE